MPITLARWLCVLAALIVAAPVAAQTAYPNKPVKMIIPFAPGGASDFVARVIQNRFAETLGQQIVIENRPGAAGVLATDIVAHAPPDGYTMFLGNIGTLAINQAVFGKTMTVDPVKDFVAVTLLADTPSLLIGKLALPPKTPRDLVAYAHANAGKLNYGSPGSGSLNRLEMELFRKIATLDMVHIPYKGGAGPAVAGVIAGEVDLMFTTASSAISHAQSGLLRAMAVTSRQRMAGLPDVPTMVEAGYPDMVTSSWQAMVLPVGTPRPIVQKVYDSLIATMKDEDVKKRLISGGMDPLLSKSPEDCGVFLAAEATRWATVVQDSGATPD